MYKKYKLKWIDYKNEFMDNIIDYVNGCTKIQVALMATGVGFIIGVIL